MITYPAPGRGAWRVTGGLLPGRPGSASKNGYYRLAVDSETPVGAGWAQRTDTSHHSYAVWLGVRAVQALVGAELDGWFGPATHVRVMAAQKRWGLDPDGVVGRDTMRAGLSMVIEEAAMATQVPLKVLAGIITHESLLDPAAVGTNGLDHGLAQINLGAHAATISVEQALDPDFALHWTGEDLSMVYRTWKNRTSADPWHIAIAHHNSPLLSRRWAVTGVAPVVEGRLFQIEDYVNAVLKAGE